MISAKAVKAGSVIRLERILYKVIESVTHQGGGKAGGMVHIKLRNLDTGHVTEKRLATDDKIEDIPVTRAKMQFLYRDGETLHFMNPETFDQIPLTRSVVGPTALFLKENDEIEVEFFEEKPLSILYPPTVELAVASTGAGLKGASTLKEAILENGMEIHVPQFIKEGDSIRVDVETGKYLDRVVDREVKGATFTVAAPAQKSGQEAKSMPESKKAQGKP